MSNEWRSVTSLRPLGTNELQVWRVRLGDLTHLPDAYRDHLSVDELERAGRLREGSARIQYVAARAALRLLLGNLLKQAPNLVSINLSAYGKPETSPVDEVPLFFNVSHCRETILIALCRSSPVGIDLEYFDRATDILEIAQESFTARELLQLREIQDPSVQRHAFFRCWTRKEAVVKADGRGLSIPLHLVEVPVTELAASSAVLIGEASEDSASIHPWFVTDILWGEETAAAVAVRTPNLLPSTLQFPLALLLDT